MIYIDLYYVINRINVNFFSHAIMTKKNSDKKSIILLCQFFIHDRMTKKIQTKNQIILLCQLFSHDRITKKIQTKNLSILLYFKSSQL
jgi:hypothetical protein